MEKGKEIRGGNGGNALFRWEGRREGVLMGPGYFLPDPAKSHLLVWGDFWIKWRDRVDKKIKKI